MNRIIRQTGGFDHLRVNTGIDRVMPFAATADAEDHLCLPFPAGHDGLRLIAWCNLPALVGVLHRCEAATA